MSRLHYRYQHTCIKNDHVKPLSFSQVYMVHNYTSMEIVRRYPWERRNLMKTGSVSPVYQVIYMVEDNHHPCCCLVSSQSAQSLLHTHAVVVIISWPGFSEPDTRGANQHRRIIPKSVNRNHLAEWFIFAGVRSGMAFPIDWACSRYELIWLRWTDQKIASKRKTTWCPSAPNLVYQKANNARTLKIQFRSYRYR